MDIGEIELRLPTVTDINDQLVDFVESIANIRLKRNYKLDAPQGVRGRNSDNTLIRSQLNWEPKYSLYDGLEKTYEWIFSEIKKKHNQ